MSPTDDRPRPPITLHDDVDLDVFADVATAVHDLEPADDEPRAAFDSLGRALKIIDDGSWPVDLIVAAGVEPRPDELTSQLRAAVRRIGPDRVGIPEPESASLDELLEGVLHFQTGTPYESTMSRLLKRLRGR